MNKPFQQDDRWDVHYQEIMDFFERNEQRPSKYNMEERHMLHWLKYNKKRMTQGKLQPERIERLKTLLAKAESIRRINQYAYVDPHKDGKPVFTELSLFDD